MKKTSSIIALLTLTIAVMAQNTNELNIGDKVPEFSGIDDTGANWKSSTVKSDFLVVYFYPAAMTGGCTAQACAYRDDKTAFDKLGATIVGISGDEVKNLKIFKEADQLNFPLISDTQGVISKKFGVPTKDGGEITREIAGENFLLVRGITASRWTFVLDKNRKIIYKNAEVNAAEDSKKVMEVIKKAKR